MTESTSDPHRFRWSAAARGGLWLAVPVAILIGDVVFRARFDVASELQKTAWTNLPASFFVSCGGWFGLTILTSRLRGRARVVALTVLASVAAFFVSAVWQYNNVIRHDPNAGVVAYALHEPTNAASLAWTAVTPLYVVGVAGLALLFFTAIHATRLEVTPRLAALAVFPVLGYFGSMAGWHDTNPSEESFYVSDVAVGVTFAHAARRLAESGAWSTVSKAERPEVTAAPVEGPLPNVLLFVGESLRRSNMSSYGYSRATTPVIDALARRDPDGFVRFDRAYSPSAVTVTAVISLFSGVYPARERSEVHSVPTIWQYADALGGSSDLVSTQLWSWANMTLHFLWDEPPTRWHTADELQLPIVNDTGVDDRLAARRMAEIIAARPSDESPWLGIFQANSTHYPFLASDEAPFELRTHADRYDAAVLTTDEAFGIILEALESSGMAEDTIIIFTSDHSEFSFDELEIPPGAAVATDRLNGGRNESCHPTITEIPFFVYVPPAVRDRLTTRMTTLTANATQVASNVDVFPTVLDLWQQPPPSHLDGRSLLRPAPEDRVVACFTTASWVSWWMEGLMLASDSHYLYLREDFPDLQAFDPGDGRAAALELRGREPTGAEREWFDRNVAGNEVLRGVMKRLDQRRGER